MTELIVAVYNFMNTYANSTRLTQLTHYKLRNMVPLNFRGISK